MNSVSVLVATLGRQARRRPLRLTLMLLQLVLAGAVLTVALHIIQAERNRVTEQTLFTVHSSAPGGPINVMISTFTPAAAKDLLEVAPDAANVATYSSLHYRPKVEVAGEVFMLSSVGRVDAAYIEMLGLTITSGSGFSAVESGLTTRVMLLEQHVAEVLFPEGDAVGSEVTVLPFSPRDRAVPYRVVGTYLYPTGSPFSAQGPLAKLPALIPSQAAGGTALIVLSEPGRTEAAKEQIVAAARTIFSGLMKQREGLDFFVQDPGRPLRFFQAVEPHLLLFALFGISSMVLAGLAVFSMTAVEVSEQSHQIGMRRALGASSWQVVIEHGVTVGVQAFVAGGVGALVALALVPVLGTNLGGSLLPGSMLTGQPVLAIAPALVVLLMSVILGLIPALMALRPAPAIALSDRL